MDRLIWQLAGFVGVNPGPLTLRELVWMARARAEDNWAHTSTVLAMLANVHRDPKKIRAFTPDDFNPLVRKKSGGRSIPITADNIEILKKLFVDRKGTNL